MVKPVLVLALVVLWSCGGRNSGDNVKPNINNSETPESITTLPGYSASLVAEPIFGGEVYVLEAGSVDAPPVVLVHGLGQGGARDWDGIIAGLASTRRVLAFDLPGFGRSTKVNELYSPERYVELIKWITSEKIGSKFDLVGHSMGATIALLYAGTHVQDVKHLVLADAAGILDRHVLIGFMAENNLLGPEVLTHKIGGVLGFIAPIFMELTEDFTPDLHLLLQSEASRDKWLKGDSGRIAALALVLEDLSWAIGSATASTLLIWGKEDSIAPLRTGQVLDQRMQNARLEVLERVGHVPMNDVPRRFEELVLDFLQTGDEASSIQTETPEGWSSTRVEKCRGKNNAIYTGDYAELHLRGCENVRIHDARIGKLVVKSSTVRIESTEIRGEDIGLDTKSSKLRMTGGSIGGSVSIRLNDSVLDLAGVVLESRDAAIISVGSSKLVASVSMIETGGESNSLHGLYSLQDGDDIRVAAPL